MLDKLIYLSNTKYHCSLPRIVSTFVGFQDGEHDLNVSKIWYSSDITHMLQKQPAWRHGILSIYLFIYLFIYAHLFIVYHLAVINH